MSSPTVQTRQPLCDEASPLLVAGKHVVNGAALREGIVERQVCPTGDPGNGGNALALQELDNYLCTGQSHQCHSSVTVWPVREGGTIKNPRRFFAPAGVALLDSRKARYGAPASSTTTRTPTSVTLMTRAM